MYAVVHESALIWRNYGITEVSKASPGFSRIWGFLKPLFVPFIFFYTFDIRQF